MKRKLPVLLSVAFGLVLLGTWLHIVDIKQTLAILKHVKVSLIFPLGILFLLIYFLRSLRWRIILAPIAPITVSEAFKLCLSNYLINFLVPIHAGEVVKCLWLKKIKGTPISLSLATAYLDKITDLLPTLLLLAAVPFLGPQVKSVIYLISGVALILFIILGFVLVSVVRKKSAATSAIGKLLFFIPQKLKLKLNNLLTLFVEGLGSLPQLSRRIFDIAALTVMALLLQCVLLWLFFYLFGIQLPAITVIVGYLLLNASFILPAPPGFSGSLELTMLFIFSYLFGYDKNIVSAIAATTHVFTAVMFGLAGFLSISLIGSKLTSLLRAESGHGVAVHDVETGA
jgi:hypothetical protein